LKNQIVIRVSENEEQRYKDEVVGRKMIKDRRKGGEV